MKKQRQEILNQVRHSGIMIIEDKNEGSAHFHFLPSNETLMLQLRKQERLSAQLGQKKEDLFIPRWLILPVRVFTNICIV